MDNHNYDSNYLPGMTLEQASHISSSQYGSYPQVVRYQAAALLAVEQQVIENQRRREEVQERGK